MTIMETPLTGAAATSRTLSIRLTDEHLNVLAFIGKVDGLTQGEVVRRAIFAFAEARLADPGFRERIEAERDAMNQALTNGLPALTNA